MTERQWTISNILSASRIVLVVPIVVFLLGDRDSDRWWAAGIMVIATLTDMFDGIIARALNQVSELGKILDPLADKIAVAVIAGALTFKGMIPLWFLVAAVMRDLLILTGGLYIKTRKNIVLQSNKLGKWTVTVMAAYIIVATLQTRSLQVLESLLLIASTMMILGSFIVYAQRFSQEMRAT
jgi:cardiolipin synthase